MTVVPDTPSNGGLEIAVVGMACRFPGAESVEQYWDNLCEGVESIKFFSEAELKKVRVDLALLNNPNFVRASCQLENIELFDAAFFGINTREAEMTDPQHRLFLECAWEALESAGYEPESYEGAIGVYAGSALNAYLQNFPLGGFLSHPVGDFQAAIGNDKDHLSTRVSYKLNLKGPSVNVQTACSTSLVAVHLACQGLVSGECDMALAGGISLIFPRTSGYLYQEGMMQSPDGRCRVFDAKAGGTIFGDGWGIVVLKRLADALADGDTVYAVIQGSAINNDGAQKVGYTAPSVDGQVKVIQMAQAIAEIEPETITYIEAHGTGTEMGDPVEIAALTKAFRASTQRKRFCAIGSVKTNIGHINTAAGVAGLIKVALALRHRQIPASLNFEEPNPAIDFANSPFYVNTKLAAWSSGATPRRAGISSFGIGGTNAHVVLEEAPEPLEAGESRPWQLLLLSARTGTALDTMTANLVKYLRANPGLNLADATYTLTVGRKIFTQRRMVVCRDVADAAKALVTLDTQRVFSTVQEHHDRPVAFMFTGQGSQYVGMGADLYANESTFRQHVDVCAELLKANLKFDLRNLLYPDKLKSENYRATDNGSLDKTWLTQPVLFVTEYALAKLWMEWGIRPQAMIGHSVGEYVAACLAGVFSIEDALALVAARARLMQSLPRGAMLSVALAEDKLCSLLGAEISLAAINAPELCVVAGPTEAVDDLEYRLRERGVACQYLQTSHAFHSAMMEPILKPFRQQVEKIKLYAPIIPYISNVTGTWVTAAEATDASYWARHLRQGVRFGDGVRELMKEQNLVLLEVGPGQTLTNLVRRNMESGRDRTVFPSLRRQQSNQSDTEFILGTLGRLWMAGVPVKWAGFYSRERRHRVLLPTYPFERRRYWVEAQKQPHSDSTRSAPVQKDPDIGDWFYVPAWKQAAPLGRFAEKTREDARYLVFTDLGGFGTRLATRLARQNHVVTVAVGEQFAKVDERRYTIRPGRSEDYKALFEELDVSGLLPDRMVHLWTLTLKERKRLGLEAFESSQQVGFYSLLYLAQAAGVRPARPLDLTVVSNDLFDVAGNENLCPEKATLLGPCKTIPQEYPSVTCRLVDLDVSQIATPREPELMDRLEEEIVSGSAVSPVAYRGRHRWIQTFDRMQFNLAADGPPHRLREEGVYLITGGLGGIGLVLAEYLVRTARAKLILIGRSQFPDRDGWEQWLASHSESDPVSHRIRKVRAIETLGTEVLVIAADVTNVEQMKAAIRLATQRLGAVHGVIHAAGIAGGGVIQLKDLDTAAKVLSPKVKGALVLDELLKDIPMDFFVLCSSMLALRNQAGQVDYCGANAFLDAYAHYKSSRDDSFTVSINWDAWQEVGMAVDNRSPKPSGANHPKPIKEIDHPLLDHLLLTTSDRLVYATDFRVAKHWVLNEHRILGTAVLPGTAYLEMARAAYRDSFKRERIEITDVYFLAPLTVGEEEQKQVFTVLERDGQICDFRIISKTPATSAERFVWREHARGRIAELTQPAVAMIVGQEILDRITDETIGLHHKEQATNGREPRVYWGSRWQCAKVLNQADDGIFARLDLPEEFGADLERLQLHPSLLDVATSLGARNASEDRYLPFSYARLEIYGPLPGKICSCVKLDESSSPSSETITLDALITDQHGEPLVQIKGLSLRRIDDTMVLLNEIGNGKRVPQLDHARLSDAEVQFYESLLGIKRHDGNGFQGILPEEGVEVFHRILTFGTVPQVAVSATDLHSILDRRGPAAPMSSVEQTSRPSSISSRHTRPNLQSAYATPQNDLEKMLVEIWQEVLGIEQVGVNDNFFELGGDSVIAIQVVAKANKAGFRFATNDIFQRQTIAELATVGQAGSNHFPEQEATANTAGQSPSSRSDDFGWTQEDRDQIGRALRKSFN